jgi:transcriptional regulator with XRE-family HTH domain
MGTSYTKEEKSYLIKVGDKIRQLRNDMGFSQEKLSFASDLDRTYIGSVERGERNISILNLQKIAIALETVPSELLKF